MRLFIHPLSFLAGLSALILSLTVPSAFAITSTLPAIPSPTPVSYPILNSDPLPEPAPLIMGECYIAANPPRRYRPSQICNPQACFDAGGRCLPGRPGPTRPCRQYFQTHIGLVRAVDARWTRGACAGCRCLRVKKRKWETDWERVQQQRAETGQMNIGHLEQCKPGEKENGSENLGTSGDNFEWYFNAGD